jgi:hypothetical protein
LATDGCWPLTGVGCWRRWLLAALATNGFQLEAGAAATGCSGDDDFQ